jgi:hypothetical protein
MNETDIKIITHLNSFVRNDKRSYETELLLSNKDKSNFKFGGHESLIKSRVSIISKLFISLQKKDSGIGGFNSSIEGSVLAALDLNVLGFVQNNILNDWVKFSKKNGIKLNRNTINFHRNAIENNIELSKIEDISSLILSTMNKYNEYFIEKDNSRYPDINNLESKDVNILKSKVVLITCAIKEFFKELNSPLDHAITEIKKEIILVKPDLISTEASIFIKSQGEITTEVNTSKTPLSFLEKYIFNKNNNIPPKHIKLNKNGEYSDFYIFVDDSIVAIESSSGNLKEVSQSNYSEMINTINELYLSCLCRKHPKYIKPLQNKMIAEDYNIKGAVVLFDNIIKYKQLLKNKRINIEGALKDPDVPMENIDDMIANAAYDNEIECYRKSFMSKKYDTLVNDDTHNLFKTIFELKLRHEVVQEGIINKIAGFESSDDFNNGLSIFINNMNNFDLETYLERISTLNVSTIYNEDNKLIVKIKDYDASKQIGSPSWCISRHESYYNNYSKDREQYFVYDFNIKSTSKECIVGITLNKNGDVYASHYKDDNNVEDNSLLNALKSIIIPNDLENFALSSENKGFSNPTNIKRKVANNV